MPAAIPAEAEVEEPSQVDGGGSDGEGLAVAFDSSVADSTVAVGDEPGDGSLDHRSVLPVVGETVTASPFRSSCGEVMIVFGDLEGLAVPGGGASCPKRAAGATRPEGPQARSADRDGDPVRAGDGASGVVDGEVIATELVVAEVRVAWLRQRLDHGGVAGCLEAGTHRA